MRHVTVAFTRGGCRRLRVATVDQLLDAIRLAEIDRGAPRANAYRLSQTYVDDVCRITGQTFGLAQATASDEMARACILAYWEHYGHAYWLRTGSPANAEVLVRIHAGGPDGWMQPGTVAYWRLVLARLLEMV